MVCVRDGGVDLFVKVELEMDSHGRPSRADEQRSLRVSGLLQPPQRVFGAGAAGGDSERRDHYD